MTKTTTTLILGAGTSMAYGYPSGRELVDLIRERFSQLDSPTRLDRELLSDLTDRRPLSIDSFLRDFEKYDGIVKTVIVDILLDREKPNVERKTPDLYGHIFESIPRDRFGEYKIITFNYDRSLEYFWARYLKPEMGNFKAAFEALSKLEIEHIHGRLPSLPDEAGAPQFGPHEQTLSYGHANERHDQTSISFHDHDTNLRDQELTQMWLRKVEFYAKGNFKTVYQNNDVNKKAKELINNSKRIFFLGFSFHELNMQILGFDWTRSSSRTIAGTCMGMTSVERAQVNKKYPIIGNYRCSALELFQHTYSLTDPEIYVRLRDQ